MRAELWWARAACSAIPNICKSPCSQFNSQQPGLLRPGSLTPALTPRGPGGCHLPGHGRAQKGVPRACILKCKSTGERKGDWQVPSFYADCKEGVFSCPLQNYFSLNARDCKVRPQPSSARSAAPGGVGGRIPLYPAPKIHRGAGRAAAAPEILKLCLQMLYLLFSFLRHVLKESLHILCILGDKQTPKTKKKGHVNIAESSVSNSVCLHINVQYKFVNMSIWNFCRNRYWPFPFLQLYWNSMSPLAPATHVHRFNTGCISNVLGAYLFWSILLSNPRLFCIIVIQIII